MSKRQPDFGKSYKPYFEALAIELAERGIENNRQIIGRNYHGYPIGIGGVELVMSFTRDQNARVEIYIHNNDELFDRLYQKRTMLCSKTGLQLNFDRLNHRQDSRIEVLRTCTIHDSPEELIKIQEWQIECFVKMREIFPDIINRIRGCA
jgi:hypothetical protein